MTKRPKNHAICPKSRRGYVVWVYGESYYHKSYRAAERRAVRAQNYASDVQIVSCATGDRV